MSVNKDSEHLNLLKIFYYIYGGISAFVYLFTFIIIGMGIAFLTGAIDANDPVMSNTQFGIVYILVGTFLFIYGFVGAIATILVGKFIKERKNYLYCLVLAGISCISFPFGTALGVFTFVVLFRGSVKTLFGKGEFYEDA